MEILRTTIILSRPRRVRSLTLARHSHEHTPALATRALAPVVRKSIDHKVNKENGELYFKTVNSNYYSNSLWTLSRSNQKNIFLHRTSLLIRAQISFPALKALQR